jgi:hypothetical protein
MLQVYAKVEWCSKNKVGRCANREFDRKCQDYGVDHYLDGTLFVNPSFLKKLHHKTLSHLFPELMTLVGTKDNMHAAIKPPNKIWYMIFKDYSKLLTFKKYQNTHKESN